MDTNCNITSTVKEHDHPSTSQGPFQNCSHMFIIHLQNTNNVHPVGQNGLTESWVLQPDLTQLSMLTQETGHVTEQSQFANTVFQTTGDVQQDAKQHIEISVEKEILKLFCSCIGVEQIFAASQEIELSHHMPKKYLPHIALAIIGGHELVIFKKGLLGKLFVSVSQLKHQKMLVNGGPFMQLSKFVDHSDNLTETEIEFLVQKGYVPNQEDRCCISLDVLRTIYKVMALEDGSDFIKQMSNSPWFVLKFGHVCPKVEQFKQSDDYVCPVCILDGKKSGKSGCQVCSRWVVPVYQAFEPRAGGFFDTDRSNTGIGFIKVSEKYVLAYRGQNVSDTLNINCLHLVNLLYNFPWKNFVELASSLSISFHEAPLWVVRNFQCLRFPPDILTGNVWCSMQDLRYIVCFSVGQRNNTSFLYRNPILPLLAQGKYEEIFMPTEFSFETKQRPKPIRKCSGNDQSIKTKSIDSLSIYRDSDYRGMVVPDVPAITHPESVHHPEDEKKCKKVVMVTSNDKLPMGILLIKKNGQVLDCTGEDGTVYRLVQSLGTNTDVSTKDVLSSRSTNSLEGFQQDSMESEVDNHIVIQETLPQNDSVFEQITSTVNAEPQRFGLPEVRVISVPQEHNPLDGSTCIQNVKRTELNAVADRPLGDDKTPCIQDVNKTELNSVAGRTHIGNKTCIQDINKMELNCVANRTHIGVKTPYIHTVNRTEELNSVAGRIHTCDKTPCIQDENRTSELYPVASRTHTVNETSFIQNVKRKEQLNHVASRTCTGDQTPYIQTVNRTGLNSVASRKSTGGNIPYIQNANRTELNPVASRTQTGDQIPCIQTVSRTRLNPCAVRIQTGDQIPCIQTVSRTELNPGAVRTQTGDQIQCIQTVSRTELNPGGVKTKTGDQTSYIQTVSRRLEMNPVANKTWVTDENPCIQSINRTEDLNSGAERTHSEIATADNQKMDTTEDIFLIPERGGGCTVRVNGKEGTKKTFLSSCKILETKHTLNEDKTINLIDTYGEMYECTPVCLLDELENKVKDLMVPKTEARLFETSEVVPSQCNDLQSLNSSTFEESVDNPELSAWSNKRLSSAARDQKTDEKDGASTERQISNKYCDIFQNGCNEPAGFGPQCSSEGISPFSVDKLPDLTLANMSLNVLDSTAGTFDTEGADSFIESDVGQRIDRWNVDRFETELADICNVERSSGETETFVTEFAGWYREPDVRQRNTYRGGAAAEQRKNLSDEPGNCDTELVDQYGEAVARQRNSDIGCNAESFRSDVEAADWREVCIKPLVPQNDATSCLMFCDVKMEGVKNTETGSIERYQSREDLKHKETVSFDRVESGRDQGHKETVSIDGSTSREDLEHKKTTSADGSESREDLEHNEMVSVDGSEFGKDLEQVTWSIDRSKSKEDLEHKEMVSVVRSVSREDLEHKEMVTADRTQSREDPEPKDTVSTDRTQSREHLEHKDTVSVDRTQSREDPEPTDTVSIDRTQSREHLEHKDTVSVDRSREGLEHNEMVSGYGSISRGDLEHKVDMSFDRSRLWSGTGTSLSDQKEENMVLGKLNNVDGKSNNILNSSLKTNLSHNLWDLDAKMSGNPDCIDRIALSPDKNILGIRDVKTKRHQDTVPHNESHQLDNAVKEITTGVPVSNLSGLNSAGESKLNLVENVEDRPPFKNEQLQNSQGILFIDDSATVTVETSDKCKNGLDKHNNCLSKCKNCFDKSKNGLDKYKNGSDKSENDLDKCKNCSDKSKKGLDNCKNGLDKCEDLGSLNCTLKCSVQKQKRLRDLRQWWRGLSGRSLDQMLSALMEITVRKMVRSEKNPKLLVDTDTSLHQMLIKDDKMVKLYNWIRKFVQLISRTKGIENSPRGSVWSCVEMDHQTLQFHTSEGEVHQNPGVRVYQDVDHDDVVVQQNNDTLKAHTDAVPPIFASPKRRKCCENNGTDLPMSLNDTGSPKPKKHYASSFDALDQSVDLDDISIHTGTDSSADEACLKALSNSRRVNPSSRKRDFKIPKYLILRSVFRNKSIQRSPSKSRSQPHRSHQTVVGNSPSMSTALPRRNMQYTEPKRSNDDTISGMKMRKRRRTRHSTVCDGFHLCNEEEDDLTAEKRTRTR